MHHRDLPRGEENAFEFENRPISRRGLKDETGQNPAGDGRTSAAGRMIMRPPSAQAFPKRTASRLSSGVLQPPKTGQSLMGITNVNIIDRPITQQGVMGLKPSTAKGPPFRQVLDKRYFDGLIRMKMKAIADEVTKLNGEIEKQQKQQATSEIYERRVREIATELTELQGQLADYNLVLDKINTNTEKSQIDEEEDRLRYENDKLASELDLLFGQNRSKEEQLQQMEQEIEKEKNFTDNLIEEMNSSDRQTYEEIKTMNEQLRKEIEQHRQVLDELSNKKAQYEDKLSGSQIRQEAVRLYRKLHEREGRKAALIEEERNRATPAQEKELLLKKMKDENSEMAAVERQILQINEQIRKKKEELELIEQTFHDDEPNVFRQQFCIRCSVSFPPVPEERCAQMDLEESQSGQYQKFKELKRREETMEQFMSTYEDSKNAEIKRIEEFEDKIVIALEQISKNLSGNGTFPSQDEFSVLIENLNMKQEELQKSKLTIDELTKKQLELSENVKKVDNLEAKIQKEIASINEKMAVMSEEMRTFEDLEKLRDEAQEKRMKLTQEREELLSSLPSLVKTKDLLHKENEELMKDLNENETYVQLNNLEKKLQLIEQNNMSMRELIASKKTEMDFEPLKENALKLVHEYNELLQNYYSTKGN